MATKKPTMKDIAVGVAEKRYLDAVAEMKSLKRGEQYVYHEGFLWVDRGAGVHNSVSEDERDTIDKIAKAAWKLYEQEKITLVQRRTSPGVCQYIALGLSEGNMTVAERRELSFYKPKSWEPV